VDLLNVRKIWDAAPHSAFTDLARFGDAWFCTFREGEAHVSPHGALRVISSSDGVKWSSMALHTSETGDLRDPKLCITPSSRLMLCAASALHQPAPASHQSVVYFSDDGRAWDGPVAVGDPGFWIWRVTWHLGMAYGVGYERSARGGGRVRLYRSTDGQRFDVLVETLCDAGFPNEATLRFLDDDTGLCLLRREQDTRSALLGIARPPYQAWRWLDLGVQVGGPNLIVLPDRRCLVGGRLYEGCQRMALCWLDHKLGVTREALALPSGGDCSYPGLVWYGDTLWVSYYSSHEGNAAIYLARVAA